MSEGQYVSDDRLAPQERLALLGLMAVARSVTNAELKAAAGIELSGEPRRRLNELKLVTSEKQGRSYVHELTESGWARCEDELSSPRPQRAGSYGGVLHGLLAALHYNIERGGPRLPELFKPDAELLIRKAYEKLADGPATPVRLGAVRDEVDGRLSRKDLDAELIRMADQPGVHLRAVVNQQTLTDADREAAVRLGGEDRHNLQIEAL
jgi:hypothetical protein